jgi:hypothetical protein
MEIFPSPCLLAILAVLALPPLVGCASQQQASTPATETAGAPQSASATEEGAAGEPDRDDGSAEGTAGNPAAEQGAAARNHQADDTAHDQPTTDPAAAGAGRAQTSEERAAELDRQLGRALEEFDGLLLEEQRRLAEEAGAAPAGSAPGGGAAGGAGSSSGELSEAADGQGARAVDGSNETPVGPESGTQSGAAGGAAGGGDASPRVPPDVGDGNDDDIIARQLREAAMEEQDPELREKLWDEYRRYKESLQDSNGSSND